MRQLFQFQGNLNLEPRRDVRPTNPVPVIRRDGADPLRRIAMLRWGFVPRFARAGDNRPLINARAETVAVKPTFRDAFARRRCLVPMDHYYEWRQGATPKSPKEPFIMARGDDRPLAIAGIWERARLSTGETVDALAILTMAAAPEIASIHDRMPVEIADNNFDLWLDPDTEPDQAAALITAPQFVRRAKPASPDLFRKAAAISDLFESDSD